MGNSNIRVDNFLHEFSAIVEDFIDEERDLINKEVRKVGRETRDELKTTTPAGAEKYHGWEDYQSGFVATEEKDGLGGITMTISNKKKPGLTHLLEEGHVNASGHGRARAFPHIAPAAEHAFDELKRRLGNG